MLTRIRWGMPLVSSTVPGGEVKPAILPVRKEAALFRGTADLKNRDIFVRLQPQGLEENSGRNIRGASYSANADAFALQVLGRFDRFVNDQLVRQGVDERADADQIGAADRRIREGAA